ncbi:hypothetical protein VTL71DRAFT_1544 [Oculimacula yallundae]|uniref:C3H1-type domain-containing protein n=1 Tax=Oculimacula yallundae TaxID=86028 RepID=A0ABR4CBG9_9HELO
MHPPSLHTNQKGKPWPAYFLVRTTGEVVPLIAVDELPPGTDLIGVPRSLDLKDTIGMLNLGLQRSSGAFYQIVTAVDNGGVKGEEATTEISSSESERTLQSSTTPTSTPPSTPPKPAPTQASRTQAPSTSPTTNNNSSHANSTQTPTYPSSQTQLCRHWCHHGICKWGQQCRYRHIMPMSTSGLSEIGLSDWPVWFRRMNPGYFAAENVHGNGNANANAGRIVGSGGGARGRRGARTSISTSGGNGGACCGVLHGPGSCPGGAGAGIARERGERIRVRGERPVGIPRERVLKSEELGEQIIARLRGMSKEYVAKDKVSEKAAERLNSSSLVERAAARETRKWEESDEEGEDSEGETVVGGGEKNGGGGGQGKLVDV